MIFVHRENHHHKSNAFFFQKQKNFIAILYYLFFTIFSVAIKPFMCCSPKSFKLELLFHYWNQFPLICGNLQISG